MTSKYAARFVAMLAVAIMVGGCARPGSPVTASESEGPVTPAAASVPASPSPELTPSELPNPCDVGTDFGEVPAGATCWIEPNAPAALESDTTPVRVFYTIPAEGWFAFIGTFKDVGQGEDMQRVSALVADVRNLTVDACTDQVALDPPIGPTVDDLATALAALPPFEVVSPPSDVTAYGYGGKHLEIMVPADQPWEVIAGTPLFTDCAQGVLRTWIAPPLSFAFYGYTAPGDTEEFWILDVEGTRVVIAALRSANASAELLAEQQEILDSIVVEP